MTCRERADRGMRISGVASPVPSHGLSQGAQGCAGAGAVPSPSGSSQPECGASVLRHDIVALRGERGDRIKGRGRKAYRALRKRGKSKSGRSDAPQVVIGLAVKRDSFPVRNWVFPGNTVAQVKRELKGWRLIRCVFVGDGVGGESVGAVAWRWWLHRVHASASWRGGCLKNYLI